MADRSYRGGRDRYASERSYSRQAEQFEPDYGWRDDERSQRQMGDGWREDDYGEFDTAEASYGRERGPMRDWGRRRGYRGTGEFNAYGPSPYGAGPTRAYGSFTGNDFGGRDFTAPRYTADRTRASEYGAGSRLAHNHGEWREDFGPAPSREDRDYRGTWGGPSDDGRGWLDRASETVAGWFGADDEGRERGYRGHGPSGYKRSDERIMEDACDALTEDWGVDARQISVMVSDGEITLDGTVPSRDQKRRAEDCVEDLSGVRHVQNNLRVQERGAWDRNNSETLGRQASPSRTET